MPLAFPEKPRRNLRQMGKFPVEVQEVFHQFFDAAMEDAHRARESCLILLKLAPEHEGNIETLKYWDHVMRAIKWFKHRVGTKQPFIRVETRKYTRKKKA